MWFHSYFSCFLAMACMSHAVKVNMQGALTLGKEVMDTITYYFRSNDATSGRRLMTDNTELAAIVLDVKTAALCSKLHFCKGEKHTFINAYVAEMTHAVEFELNEATKTIVGQKHEPIFKQLKGILRDVKRILKKANDKQSSDIVYTWINVIKKISLLFQCKSSTYIADSLRINNKNAEEVKKKINHKVVLRIIEIETTYQKKLCAKYEICQKTFECTKTLITVLDRVLRLSKEKTKEFMKAFNEQLLDTTFYSRLNEITTNEFQIILNDMAFVDKVPTHQVLETVKKTAELRLSKMFSENEERKQGHDVLLLNVLLSDMDFLFSKGRSNRFHSFLSDFIEWAVHGGKAKKATKKAFKELESVLSAASEELRMKLTYEVRVFLEITVDPDKKSNKST